MKTPETYAEARTRLWQQLGQLGYAQSRPGLKMPWVTVGDGRKLTFHAQAVYLNDHSLHCDIRNMSVGELLQRAEK